jgi:hypothetical protein
MRKYIYVVIVLFISGCAFNSHPSISLIETVPVVQVGQYENVPQEHIVFIPANTEFPIRFSVKGTVFNKNSASTVMTSFKQDIYLYKYWASLDGKKWVNSHKLMSVKPSGGFDNTGGKVEVELDLNY